MNNNIIDTSIESKKISPRLTYFSRSESNAIVDVAPPIFILPFVMNAQNTNIQYLFLHEYTDMFDKLKTTVLDISPYNFDSNIDVIRLFISKYFSIPTTRIEKDRIFFLGETDVNISLFKSEPTSYAFNLTGLIQDDEVKVKLEDNDRMVRVPYYDIMKGHYNDVMTMATTFQLMSYFML